MRENSVSLAARLTSFFELSNRIPELKRRLFLILVLIAAGVMLTATVLLPLRGLDYTRLFANFCLLAFLSAMAVLLWRPRDRQELTLLILFLGTAAWVLAAMLYDLLRAGPFTATNTLLRLAAPWMIWLLAIYLLSHLTFRPRTALRMSLLISILCMTILLLSIIRFDAFQPLVLFDFILVFFANGLVIGMAFPLAQSQEISSQTDFLTELPNRSRGYTRLVAEIERSERYNEPFSIILFDIDHFKKINDECGHPCGDVILRQVASFTNSRIRRSDLLTRWGGEEFLLLMTHCDLASARLKADHMRQQIKSAPFHKNMSLTASFGVTTYYPFDSAASMLERVDTALYRAKRNGRNCVEVE